MLRRCSSCLHCIYMSCLVPGLYVQVDPPSIPERCLSFQKMLVFLSEVEIVIHFIGWKSITITQPMYQVYIRFMVLYMLFMLYTSTSKHYKTYKQCLDSHFFLYRQDRQLRTEASLYSSTSTAWCRHLDHRGDAFYTYWLWNPSSSHSIPHLWCV